MADQVESASVLSLYPAIRNGSIPGIHFAVYANGYIGNVPGVTSAGDSVNIGQGGGVFYSVIGDPSLDQLVAARNLISMMGRGGVDASGFGYATETLSGNGIEYYLGTIILAKASPENQLVRYGFDSGLLDRSGYLTLP